MQIPKRPSVGYDGTYISNTKDCPSCSYRRRIDNQDICGGGTAFRYISRVNAGLNGGLRKCGNLSKKAPSTKRSVEYLDEIISGFKS